MNDKSLKRIVDEDPADADKTNLIKQALALVRGDSEKGRTGQGAAMRGKVEQLRTELSVGQECCEILACIVCLYIEQIPFH